MRRVMGAGFVLALAVRLAYLAAFRHSPFFHAPMVDAAWHDAWAWDWVQGTASLEGRGFFRAPLYPLYLAFQYLVAGHDFLAARVIQAVVGAAGVAALAGAGWRIGGARAGWAAAVLGAGYGPWVFFDGELLIPALLLPLLAWALFLLTGGPGRWRVFGAAALLGLAVIARPNALVLAVPAAWWLWRTREPLRRLAAALVLFLVPALLVTAVNWRVEGSPVFVAWQGGVNFYAGNHAGASGRSVEIPEFADHVSWREFVPATVRVAEDAVGRPLSSREVSNWWLHRGLDFWREDPASALALTGRKLYYAVNAFEVPNNRDLYFERPGILRALVWHVPGFAFPWGLVFPLAVLGCVAGVRSARTRAAAVSLGLWVLCYLAAVTPFFVAARFRMGAVPALILLAALGLAHLRHAGRAGWAAALVALVLVNSSFADVRAQNESLEWSRLAEAQRQMGNPAEAAAALERSLERHSGNQVAALMLAQTYVELGRVDDALAWYDRLLEVRGTDPDVRFSRGVALLQGGRYAEAESAMLETLRLSPGDAAAWVNLGAAREALADTTGALEAYAEGMRQAPHDALAYQRMGLLLLEGGRTLDGISVLEAAVDRLQTSFELRFQLAAAYTQAGNLDRALEEIDTCLHLRPDDPDALRMQRWLNERLGR